jgi:hypothetical protein
MPEDQNAVQYRSIMRWLLSIFGSVMAAGLIGVVGWMFSDWRQLGQDINDLRTNQVTAAATAALRNEIASRERDRLDKRVESLERQLRFRTRDD